MTRSLSVTVTWLIKTLSHYKLTVICPLVEKHSLSLENTWRTQKHKVLEDYTVYKMSLSSEWPSNDWRGDELYPRKQCSEPVPSTGIPFHEVPRGLNSPSSCSELHPVWAWHFSIFFLFPFCSQVVPLSHTIRPSPLARSNAGCLTRRWTTADRPHAITPWPVAQPPLMRFTL